MDLTQALLLSIVLVLTVMLVVIGFQVFFILKEFRNALGKANKVLDDAGTISESIKAPISSLSQIGTGLQAGTILSAFFKKIRERQERHHS